MIRTSILVPGESIEVEYRWEQRNANGSPVSAGATYEARATLYLLGPRPDLDIRYISAAVRIS